MTILHLDASVFHHRTTNDLCAVESFCLPRTFDAVTNKRAKPFFLSLQFDCYAHVERFIVIYFILYIAYDFIVCSIHTTHSNHVKFCVDKQQPTLLLILYHFCSHMSYFTV